MTEHSRTANGLTGQSSPPARQRDVVLAWATDAVACTYLGWLFWVLWRGGRVFKNMFDSLGAQPSPLTQFAVDHGVWLMPCLYSAFAGTIVGKEAFIYDKRYSTMLTCLLTIVAQWVAQGLLVAYYLPLVNMIGKLS